MISQGLDKYEYRTYLLFLAWIGLLVHQIMLKPIPNQDLELGKIPDPEGDPLEYIKDWEMFALTLNGYELMEGHSECASLTNEVIKDPTNATLTELRCALFFCQRAHRHSGGMNVGEQNGKHLIKLIREKVKRGDLE